VTSSNNDDKPNLGMGDGGPGLVTKDNHVELRGGGSPVVGCVPFNVSPLHPPPPHTHSDPHANVKILMLYATVVHLMDGLESLTTFHPNHDDDALS
jgi:hypothetical protein